MKNSKAIRILKMMVLVYFSALAGPSLQLANAETVEQVLSNRHVIANISELEQLAGGKDALIAELLVLRKKPVPPYLSIRAEKALLDYSDDEKVLAALESDLDDPATLGLARIVALHFDKVKNPLARERLKKSVLNRSEREPAFRPYLRIIAADQPTK